MSYATVQNVLDRWVASAIPPDEAVIQKKLDDAAVIIDLEFPNLKAQVVSDPEIKKRAELVACRMVTRDLQNPDRIRQMQDTTGPFSSGLTYAAETLGDLALTPDDRAILEGRAATRRRAFSINTLGGLRPAHSRLCSIYFGSSCSCGAELTRGGALYERGHNNA